MFPTHADPDLKYEVHDDQINRQILDALNQVGLKLVNDSGANSLAMIHAVATETSGMAMHNAVDAQRQMQTLSAASVTATCAKLLGMAGTFPAPKKPAPPTPQPPAPMPPAPILNPFNPLSGGARPSIPPILIPGAGPQPASTSGLVSNLSISNIAVMDVKTSGDTTTYQVQVQTAGSPLNLSFTQVGLDVKTLVTQATSDGNKSIVLPSGSPPTYALSATVVSVIVLAVAGPTLSHTYIINFNP